MVYVIHKIICENCDYEDESRTEEFTIDDLLEFTYNCRECESEGCINCTKQCDKCNNVYCGDCFGEHKKECKEEDEQQ